MCRSLFREDAGDGTQPGGAHIQRTLGELERNPIRGKAVVLEVHRKISGYALLIPYWSNEFGGEICTIDELFVEPESRSKGYASELIQMLQRQPNLLWPGNIVGLVVYANQTNPRAKALYEKLNFEPKTNDLLMYLMPHSQAVGTLG